MSLGTELKIELNAVFTIIYIHQIVPRAVDGVIWVQLHQTLPPRHTGPSWYLIIQRWSPLSGPIIVMDGYVSRVQGCFEVLISQLRAGVCRRMRVVVRMCFWRNRYLYILYIWPDNWGSKWTTMLWWWLQHKINNICADYTGCPVCGLT